MSELFSTISTELMPEPACTPEGACRECGQIVSHLGTCSWSIMRSGKCWVPQAWKVQMGE